MKRKNETVELGEGQRDEDGHDWSLLPPEIFTLIFLYCKDELDSAVVVNKQWRVIICAMRTKVAFERQHSLDDFQWHMFPNVYNVIILLDSVLSLRYVPARVSRLEIPNKIKNYQHLDVTYLHVKEIKAKKMEKYLRTFSNLQCLRIGNERSVPKKNCVLTRLVRLELRNYDQELPDWAIAMTQLEKLSIRGSKFGAQDLTSPDGVDLSRLTNLTNLTGLAIHSTRVSNALAIYHLTKLRSLKLSQFPLSERIGSLTRLTSFLWTHNCEITIPDTISCLENLTSIDLTWGMICKLPDMRALTRLVRLRANDNRLEELRAEWLPASLTSLNVSMNKIKAIPDNFEQFLTRLTNLDIHGNTIGGSLRNLPTSLVILTAYSTGITDIDYITCLRNLEVFHVWSTKLRKIPDVKGLTRLRSLIT